MMVKKNYHHMEFKFPFNSNLEISFENDEDLKNLKRIQEILSYSSLSNSEKWIYCKNQRELMKVFLRKLHKEVV